MPVFVYANWLLLFPQFSNVTEAQADLLVPTAQAMMCGFINQVTNSGLQMALLNYMVAHLAQLSFGSTTQPANAFVGRISNATQGSVSVATEFPMTQSNAWYAQTPYGLTYWQLSLPFRLGRYVPKVTPQRQFVGGGRWGW